MKNKINLANLRSLETSKEEMKFIKGGDDPEQGPVTCQMACDCTVACIDGINIQQTEYSAIKNNNSSETILSAVGDAVTTIALLWLGRFAAV